MAITQSEWLRASMKKFTLQFIKYFGVAGIGYVVDFGTMILCKEFFHLHYLVSATLGFILGLIVVYILSGRYVFGKSKLSSRRSEFIVFALIGVVGLVILNLLMWVLTGGLHVDYILSKVLATVIVYAWNFFARRALYHS